MRLSRIIPAFALCAALPAAQGADLVAVYRDALVSDPVFLSARAAYQAGMEKYPQARAGYLPSVNGNASAFRNDVKLEGQGHLKYDTTVYGVTLTQPIFRLQNWIALGQGRQQVVQAEAAFGTAQEDLILRVAQAYFDVLLAQDNVALSEAQKVAISEQLAQAKRNFEVGTSTIVDTLEAQARYDQSGAKAISDANDLEIKKRALQQLVGKPIVGLTPLRDPLQLAPPRPASAEEWEKSAVDSSFSVAFARAGLEIAQSEVNRQRAGHLPTVDLSGSYTHGHDPTKVVPGVIGAGSEVTSLGVVLSVPIFAGGLTQSRVREALANRTKAEQDFENTQRGVVLSVRTNFLNVTSGIAQVQALEQALASTQSQLDSTILGRDVGVRTSVDVLNAQQQVFQTRRDLQQARYNYLISTLRLKAATGILAEADVEELNRTLAR